VAERTVKVNPAEKIREQKKRGLGITYLLFRAFLLLSTFHHTCFPAEVFR
jgi:hypothetical protein